MHIYIISIYVEFVGELLNGAFFEHAERAFPRYMYACTYMKRLCVCMKYLNNTNGSPVHGDAVDVFEIANGVHLSLILVNVIAIS